MLAHATVEEEDRARKQWFEEREQRKREREAEAGRVEERRREVIELIRRQGEKEGMRTKGRWTEDEAAEGGKEGREKGGGFWGSVRK